MQSLVEFRDVSLGYHRKNVLEDVSFDMRQGEILGIVGPNGAGKTTLLKAILGMLKPRSGKVIRNSQQNSPLRFGYVPQRQVIDETYPLSVLDVVLMGRYGLIGPLRRPNKSDIDYALECLDYVGISDRAKDTYSDLSGGLKQRALVARALAAEPSILILDEPTTDMDLGAEKSMMDLVKRLRDERGLTVVIVSHTLSVVLNYADKVAFVVDNAVRVGLMNEMINDDNLSSLYSSKVCVGEVCGRKVVV